MSAFKKLASKIEAKEGVSKESADAITASIGRRKYGERGMVARQIKARKMRGRG